MTISELKLWLIAGLILVQVGTAEAEIYQWRDADGKLHFSDKKPKNKEAKDISGELTPVNIDQSRDEREKLNRLYAPETPEEQALAEQQRQQQEQKKSERELACDKARKNLALLQGPVFFEREDGSTYTISETERKQRARDFQAMVEKHCGK